MVMADGRVVEQIEALEEKVRQLESEVATLQDDHDELKKTVMAIMERLL
jgi:uncharacterized protein (UPF0335 family)